MVTWEELIQKAMDEHGEAYPGDVYACTVPREVLQEEWKGGEGSRFRAPSFWLWTEDRVYVSTSGALNTAGVRSYPRDPTARVWGQASESTASKVSRAVAEVQYAPWGGTQAASGQAASGEGEDAGSWRAHIHVERPGVGLWGFSTTVDLGIPAGDVTTALRKEVRDVLFTVYELVYDGRIQVIFSDEVSAVPPGLERGSDHEN